MVTGSSKRNGKDVATDAIDTLRKQMPETSGASPPKLRGYKPRKINRDFVVSNSVGIRASNFGKYIMVFERGTKAEKAVMLTAIHKGDMRLMIEGSLVAQDGVAIETTKRELIGYLDVIRVNDLTNRVDLVTVRRPLPPR